jgi:hypothetical protein
MIEISLCVGMPCLECVPGGVFPLNEITQTAPQPRDALWTGPNIQPNGLGSLTRNSGTGLLR